MNTRASPAEKPAAPRKSIGEIFLVALRLGLTSFGGPIAHLGYFRDEYVHRRKWLDDSAYADLVALCQFTPGAASSKVGIGIGLSVGGLPGAFAAWLAFTLPSALALVLFAHGVTAYGDLLESGFLHGLKVVAVAVVGGDLGEPDGLDVVLGLVHSGIGDLHRVNGQAVARDRADPPHGLLHGQGVARGMVQDVQGLAVAGHLPHVLPERPVVDLDPGEHQHPLVAGREIEPVALVDPVVVIGDGECVDPGRCRFAHQGRGRRPAVGCRRVEMEVDHRALRAGRRPDPARRPAGLALACRPMRARYSRTSRL